MNNLKTRIEAERRVWPWPQFGASPDPQQAARDGFNMAIDIILDILDTYNSLPDKEDYHDHT